MGEDQSKPHQDTITVLLVDDQPVVAEGIRSMLKDEADVTFHYCQDPSLAIKTAEAVHPTVILQDLVMPDIDGLLLVRYLRANAATKTVPLVVLSSEEDPKIKADAFALGVNDYMVKLPQKAELVARIRYHSGAYNSLIQRNEAYRQLEESQEALRRDLADAADYVKSILPPKMESDCVRAEWRFLPSAALGGDSFGYHWLDDDHFAIYLLDVCGHGVGAALLSISVANLLRTQTLPNTNFFVPHEVLRALNERFQMDQQRNMFFTMWYGVYQHSHRLLTYASAGHPPAILVSGRTAKSTKTQKLRTQGLVVGGMPATEYESATATIEAFNRLYVFSDGLYEVFSKEGTILDLENVIQFIEQPRDSLALDQIIQYSQTVNGPGPFPDDVSLLGISFLD
jgi:sigma-B regulation protein RsbU (phosphoserine phosphatase)